MYFYVHFKRCIQIEECYNESISNFRYFLVILKFFFNSTSKKRISEKNIIPTYVFHHKFHQELEGGFDSRMKFTKLRK